MDDASTDRFARCDRSFLDARVRLLVNERNVGYIATLKRLIEEASTDIVAILDADDAVPLDATERLRTAYAANPGAEFVYSRFATYDESLETMRRSTAPPFHLEARYSAMEWSAQIRSFRRQRILAHGRAR